MKTIGLIGGMSWESTASYYRLINESIKKQRGGLHSAKLVLVSVDFADIEKLQHQGDWDKTADILINAAQSLEKAGADFILICTNTMHLVAPQIEARITIPLLHIADATAQEVKKSGIRKIGLLGTAFTMEEDFYKGRLVKDYDLDVVIPNQADRKIIHQVIYNELCLGNVRNESKKEFVRIIESLVEQGAEGVILGCTEIALLIKPEDAAIPLFDTTEIHALKAVESSLKIN